MLFTTLCGARNSRMSLDNLSYFLFRTYIQFGLVFTYCVRLRITFLPSDSSVSKDEGIQPVPYPAPFKRLNWQLDALTKRLEFIHHCITRRFHASFYCKRGFGENSLKRQP